jgi:hypothetical protein
MGLQVFVAHIPNEYAQQHKEMSVMNFQRYFKVGVPPTEADRPMLERCERLYFTLSARFEDNLEFRRIDSAISADLLRVKDDGKLSGILVLWSMPYGKDGMQVILQIVLDDPAAEERLGLA